MMHDRHPVSERKRLVMVVRHGQNRGLQRLKQRLAAPGRAALAAAGPAAPAVRPA